MNQEFEERCFDAGEKLDLIKASKLLRESLNKNDREATACACRAYLYIVDQLEKDK